MAIILEILSLLGIGGILLFFIKRYFDKKDREEEKRREEQAKEEAKRKKQSDAFMHEIKISLETLRLLAYARMNEELERLLTQGYATPSERRIVREMHDNYKAHGWNGDMDERLKMVFALPTIPKKAKE